MINSSLSTSPICFFNPLMKSGFIEKNSQIKSKNITQLVLSIQTSIDWLKFFSCQKKSYYASAYNKTQSEPINHLSKLIKLFILALNPKINEIHRSFSNHFMHDGLPPSTLIENAQYAISLTVMDKLSENLMIGQFLNAETLLKIGCSENRICPITGRSRLIELLMSPEDPPIHLLQRFIDSRTVNQPTKNTGDTPLIFAVCNAFDEAAMILIKSHADINHQNHKGNSPIIFAVKKNNAVLLQLLINSKADINIQNSEGDTPLILAARNWNSEILNILIKEGALLDLQNQEGNTAIIEAYKCKNLEGANILKDANANLLIHNKLLESGLELLKVSINREHKMRQNALSSSINATQQILI